MFRKILFSLLLSSMLLVVACSRPEKNVISLKYVSLDRVEKSSGSTPSGKFYTYNFTFYSNKKISELYEHIISTEMRCLLFNERNTLNTSNNNWKKIKEGAIFATGDVALIKQDSNMYLYVSELYFVDDGFNPVTDYNQYMAILDNIDKNNGEIICKINVSGNSNSGSNDKESPSYSDGINLPVNLFINKIK
ncbi:hypothetical protein V3F60_004064 [Salmonella enterica]